MARRSVIEILEGEITHRLDAETKRVFTVKEFRDLFKTLSESFSFPQVLTFKTFCKYFEERELLRIRKLDFPWREFTRYVWREKGEEDIEVVASLEPTGYFSHFTAARLLGLTQQNPKTIYFNVEQSPKPPGAGLSQVTIDRAFKGKPRLSKQIVKFGDQTVCYLMGKSTDDLGVVKTESGIRHTDLERTLIDIAVRPVHCGGIDEVMRIYERAATEFKEVISINKLRSYLSKLQYIYPYQQSIGYLLNAAGFQSPIISLLKEDVSEFNFYLDYGIKDAVFDPKWKLFIPKHFQVTA